MDTSLARVDLDDAVRESIIEEAPLATTQATPLATKLDIKTLADEQLLGYRAGITEQIADMYTVRDAIDGEIKRRMVERNQRKMAHRGFKRVELTEVFTPYLPDLDLLQKAAAIFKERGFEEEANKLARFVPEEVTVVAAHWVAGNTTSIQAIVKAYGDDPVLGPLLKPALTRTKTDDKLVIEVAK